MISHSGNGIVLDCNLKRAGGIEHAIRIVARLDRLHSGEDTSMLTPAMIRFCRPIYSIATSPILKLFLSRLDELGRPNHRNSFQRRERPVRTCTAGGAQSPER